MKFNFKKISAIAVSALMVGLTMGTAAAANYPSPFIVGGVADVGVVYGTGSGVSDLDQVQAYNINLNLQTHMGTSTGTADSSTGDITSIGSDNDRIWLNTSLNTATSSLTKSKLPTVLGETTFSGNVDAKLTSSIKILSGAAAGGSGSNKVIFAKQPKSTNDPDVGISLGSSSQPMYNASVTMKAVNFTHSDSEGETITLFGRDFVISTATDTSDLVLFSSAEQVSLTLGGDSPVPSATINIDETDYIVTLVVGTSTTATIDVNGERKEISEGSSKKVGGIEVAVKSVTESTAQSITTTTLLVGSEKMTFTHGTQVTLGSDDDPVDGSMAYISGGPNATTELAVAVYRPDTSHDAIMPGESFVDPVFGSFKTEFTGLSSPLDDESREIITVSSAGNKIMDASFTDSDGQAGSFTFAYNTTCGALHYKPANWRLADDSNYSIYTYEMANLSEFDYTILGNQDHGHLLRVIDIYNSTTTTYTNDRVTVEDVMCSSSGGTSCSIAVDFTSEGNGKLNLDGKEYTATFTLSGDDGSVQFKYPTSESGDAYTFVLYPTIETDNGANFALYEPLYVNLTNFNQSGMMGYGTNTFRLPDGDGYTDIVATYAGGNVTYGNWTITGLGNTICTGQGCDLTAGNLTANATIGDLTYSFFSGGTAAAYVNMTTIYLVSPESTAVIDQPAVVLFEEKDDNNEYHAIVVDLETKPAGTGTDGVGVEDVLFTQYQEYAHYSETLDSDSDITQDVDWWGSLVTSDANDATRTKVNISYPTAQVYSKIYIGEETAVITAGTAATTGTAQLGNVVYKDTETSSYSTKNVVIVGGSCINSAAASLVGGAHCSADWTDATGVGSGEFLIKGYASSDVTSKFALLVAGYDAADTVNAATYLTNKKPDTSKSWKGTTATEAATEITEA